MEISAIRFNGEEVSMDEFAREQLEKVAADDLKQTGHQYLLELAVFFSSAQ